MTIEINDQRRIQAIQEEFNACYPFLKIEFFAKSNKAGGPSSKRIIGNPGKTIGECRTIHNNGHITIAPTMTVTDLEQRFSDVYGLHVHLLRKSGSSWLDTSVTDGWTLEEQNSQGEAISRIIKS